MSKSTLYQSARAGPETDHRLLARLEPQHELVPKRRSGPGPATCPFKVEACVRTALQARADRSRSTPLDGVPKFGARRNKRPLAETPSPEAGRWGAVRAFRSFSGPNRARALGAERERRYRRRLAAVGGGKESRSFLVGIRRRVVR